MPCRWTACLGLHPILCPRDNRLFAAIFPRPTRSDGAGSVRDFLPFPSLSSTQNQVEPIKKAAPADFSCIICFRIGSPATSSRLIASLSVHGILAISVPPFICPCRS